MLVTYYDLKIGLSVCYQDKHQNIKYFLSWKTEKIFRSFLQTTAWHSFEKIS